VFEIVNVLNFEARRILFGVVMDVFCSGRGEVEPADILVSVLRAPSLANDLRSAGANIEGLLSRLAAPSPGSSGYERLEKLVSEAERGEQLSEDPASALGLPPTGGFVGLALSATSKKLVDHMGRSFAGAAPESLTPRQLLNAVLSSSPGLAELCAEFGVRGADS
jgi:hypothetical protein